MRLTNIIDAAGHKTIWSGSSDDFNVFLCGSFNDWKTAVTQMEKTRLVYFICIELPVNYFLVVTSSTCIYHYNNCHSSGKFRTSIALSPGTYEYKFCVDGQWFHDPYKVDMGIFSVCMWGWGWRRSLI